MTGAASSVPGGSHADSLGITPGRDGGRPGATARATLTPDMGMSPPPAGAIAFRQLLADVPTSVAVATVRHAEAKHGVTLGSFVSVSLKPALVLFCLARRSRFHSLLCVTETFALNVLSHHQWALAEHFSDPHRPFGDGQFADVDHVDGQQTGAPLLMGATAVFECQMVSSREVGDHHVLVAQVVSGTASGERALIRQSGSWGRAVSV